MATNHHQQAEYFEEPWEYVEGIEEAKYAFGPDREWPGTAPTAPTSGVRVRRGNPMTPQAQALAAQANLQPKPSDVVFTIWGSTLGSDSWKPAEGDILIILRNGAEVERWIIRSAKTAVYGKQYVTYCTESPLNQNTVR